MGVLSFLETALPAVLACVGAVAGALVGGLLQVHARQRDFRQNLSKELVLSQLRLMERMTLALARLERAEFIVTIYDTNLDSSQQLELNKEALDIHAELNASANLALMWFGPKTAQYVDKMMDSDPWYAIDHMLKREALTCMRNEILKQRVVSP